MGMADSGFARLAGAAREEGKPLPPEAIAVAEVGVADAYALQSELTEWFRQNGHGQIGGYKLGATTETMQSYLGVASPVYGHIMTHNILHHGDTFKRVSTIETGAECELAVCLMADMPLRTEPWTSETVRPYLDWVAPAIEIVENRYGDFASMPLGPMVADDFFHRACVIGAPVHDWQHLDLAAISARLLRDDEDIDGGTGAEVLGHPFNSVAAVATMLAERGVSMSAGQIVMTGSMVRTVWAERNTKTFESRLSSVGHCLVHVFSSR